MHFFKNNRGAAAVEFALVALPVFMFIFGIMQTAWIVWAENLLHVSVDTAARCAAVNSSTPPCNGNTLPDMKATAATVFTPVSGAKFLNNGPCTADQGAGLSGQYDVSILFVVNLTLTADSCYPTVIVPPEPS
jgi:Flp pilus assembly protein TadG